MKVLARHGPPANAISLPDNCFNLRISSVMSPLTSLEFFQWTSLTVFEKTTFIVSSAKRKKSRLLWVLFGFLAAAGQ